MGWRYQIFTGGDPTVIRNFKFLAAGRGREQLPDGHLAEARARLDTVGISLSKILAH